jgi:hypothetical protein
LKKNWKNWNLEDLDITFYLKSSKTTRYDISKSSVTDTPNLKKTDIVSKFSSKRPKKRIKAPLSDVFPLPIMYESVSKNHRSYFIWRVLCGKKANWITGNGVTKGLLGTTETRRLRLWPTDLLRETAYRS